MFRSKSNPPTATAPAEEEHFGAEWTSSSRVELDSVATGQWV